MPKTEFTCNYKPSKFAYPPPIEEVKKETTKVQTAILSVTGKKKEKKQKEEKVKEKGNLKAFLSNIHNYLK